MSSFTLTQKKNQEVLTLEDLHLSPQNTKKIYQLLDEFNYREALRAYGLPVDNKILLHGHSGCGKTATAHAIAKRLNKKIITLQLGGFVSSKLGETAKNITAVFRNARLEKAVLFIDEFDFLGKARDYDQQDSGEMKRLVNTILQHIDELDKNTLLIGATNFIEVIDNAILRRFQLKLAYEMPTATQLENYYNHLFQKFPVEYTQFDKKFGISYAEAKDYTYQKVKEKIIETEKAKKQYLFSYGTLQLEKVQKENYGRILKGTADQLCGYQLEDLKIKNSTVIAQSGMEMHPIAVKTNNDKDCIEGMIYEISTEELYQTDRYEVEDYKRIEETFESGKKAWIYIKKFQ